MPVSRFYYPNYLKPHTEVLLTEEMSHHLSHVLRAKVNSEIILFNGHDEFKAVIIAIERKSIRVQLREQVHTPNRESPLHIHLGQAISRHDRMDYAIQKATELGVAEITPLVTEHCHLKLDLKRADSRLQHWQKIAISACEQCGRTKIPVVNPIKKLSMWHQENNDPGIVCALMPPGEQVLSTPVEMNEFYDGHLTAHKMIKLLIGPEGGLSSDEVLTAMRVYQYRALLLGPRVLRTETATVAALTLLQHYWGDL